MNESRLNHYKKKFENFEEFKEFKNISNYSEKNILKMLNIIYNILQNYEIKMDGGSHLLIYYKNEINSKLIVSEDINNIDIDDIYTSEINEIISELNNNYLSDDNKIDYKDIKLPINIDKILKLRSIIHKLILDYNNYKNEGYKNIKLLTSKYFKCLEEQVKKKINDKIKDDEILKKFLNVFFDDSFKYKIYTTNRSISIFATIFFKKFLNDNCYFSNFIIEINKNNEIVFNKLIFDTIRKCKKKYCIIQLASPGHRNLLIIDCSSKKIYHYEPNGYYDYIYKSNKLLLLNWYKYKLPLKKFILDYINDTNETIKDIYTLLIPSDENYENITGIPPDESYVYIFNNNYDTSHNNDKYFDQIIVEDILQYFNKTHIFKYDHITFSKKFKICTNDENINDLVKIFEKNKLNDNINNNYLNKLFILFKKYLPEYKYYSPYSLCYLNGFNNKTDYMEKSFDPYGYCVTVSYLYLYYFIYFIEKKEYYNITQSDIKFSILMSQLIQKNIPADEELNIKRNFSSILFQYYYKFIYDLLNKYKILNLKINIDDDIKKYIDINLQELKELKETSIYELNFIITNKSISIKLKIDSYLIEFSFKDNKIEATSNNFNIDQYRLYNFIQWLSFNYIYMSKITFLNLFYYETIIKGTTFFRNMIDCDKVKKK